MTAPGGILWLLRHELRLAWYGAAVNGHGKRRPGALVLVMWTLGWIVLHVAAWELLRAAGPDVMGSPLLAVGAGAAVYLLLPFMLAQALRASVLALFERGDLDLLLSSPLPSRSIFAVRLVGVAGASCALFLYLLAPLANVALAQGRPGWLGIYVVLGAAALLAACGAMLATLLLVRLLGPRRTRVLAQVLAGVAGALLFLVTQAGNLMGRDAHGAAPGAAVWRALTEGPLGAGSPVWLPGRAALGDPGAMLLLAVLAAGATAATVAGMHRFFAHGLQQAAGMARAAPRPAGAIQFAMRANLFDTVLVKEWRMIARDPHLISQVLLQCVYMVPLLLLVLRNDAARGPALAAGLALLSSSLSGALAWIVIAGEEAPDLLASAPAARRTIRLAKLAAATMPVLLLVAVPLLWMVVRTPVSGLLACFTTSAALLGAGLIVLWAGRPAPRSDFRARGKENMLSSMCGLLNGLCWGGLAWLLQELQHGGSMTMLLGAAATLAGGMLTLSLAWWARIRPL